MQKVNLGGQQFNEMVIRPGNCGPDFPDGFGVMLRPVYDGSYKGQKRPGFPLNEWLDSGNHREIGAKMKEVGVAIFDALDLSPGEFHRRDQLWESMAADNILPWHCDPKVGKNVIVLAQESTGNPRNFDTHAGPARLIMDAITREAQQVMQQGAYGPSSLADEIKIFADDVPDSELGAQLTRFDMLGAKMYRTSEIEIRAEAREAYFDFLNRINQEASPRTVVHRWPKNKASVLLMHTGPERKYGSFGSTVAHGRMPGGNDLTPGGARTWRRFVA